MQHQIESVICLSNNNHHFLVENLTKQVQIFTLKTSDSSGYISRDEVDDDQK